MNTLELIDEKRELNFGELSSYMEQYHKLGYWCSVEINHEIVNDWGLDRDYYSYALKVFKEKD